MAKDKEIKCSNPLNKKLLLAAKKIIQISTEVTQETIKNMSRARAPEAAASIAYYALFSLFPLLLVLVIGGSYFLQRSVVQQQLVSFFTQVIPNSSDLISQNINQVFQKRTTFGLVALISLLWSASGVFNTLAVNVNRAWPEAQSRGVVGNRLIALAMMGGVAVIFSISLTVTTLAKILPHFNIPLLGIPSPYETLLWKIAERTIPFLFLLLSSWGLYRWIPNLKVRRRSSLIGALTTAALWRIFANTFTWFLSSGLGRYDLVYGSLGTIVAVMFWIYLSTLIFLLGAHLTASVDRHIEASKLVKTKI